MFQKQKRMLRKLKYAIHPDILSTQGLIAITLMVATLSQWEGHFSDCPAGVWILCAFLATLFIVGIISAVYYDNKRTERFNRVVRSTFILRSRR